MYETVVVIYKGTKYLLTYNPTELSVDELADIIDFEDEDMEVWNDTLMDYDSQITEYEEYIID